MLAGFAAFIYKSRLVLRLVVQGEIDRPEAGEDREQSDAGEQLAAEQAADEDKDGGSEEEDAGYELEPLFFHVKQLLMRRYEAISFKFRLISRTSSFFSSSEMPSAISFRAASGTSHGSTSA